MPVTIGQNEYHIPCGAGFTCLGFDVCLQRTADVARWLGWRLPRAERGTMAAYSAYEAVMAAARAYARESGLRCPAELEPRLIGLEGKRVEVAYADGAKSRFYVGKSTGWLPVHLEIKRRNSSGGAPVYLPDTATLRVIR